MSVIERVMKAYASKHDLNPEQATLVRVELSKFIGELMSGIRPEPEIVNDGLHRAAGASNQGSISRNQPDRD